VAGDWNVPIFSLMFILYLDSHNFTTAESIEG
jgi:hypothetical protein